MKNLNNRNKKLVPILTNFGLQCCEGHEQYVTSFVTELTQDGHLNEITLYFIAPEISYEYRAINVEMQNENLIIRFFTLATKQAEPYEVFVTENDLSPFQHKLNQISNLGLFKAALEFLINQTKLKREYKYSPIKDKIVIGQARIALLSSGEKINVGWIRFDGDYVVYYTGKGLREIWKPNMTAEEQERANMLKKMDESELIHEGMIDRILISDILDLV
jgi:hypothetical protein